MVVGHQWWWEFRYYFSEDVDGDMLGDRNLPPADIVTSGQMIIPTGEEIELLVTSRDVIHSFWIPALNGKRDAAGFCAPWKIEADNPGVYFGQCAGVGDLRPYADAGRSHGWRRLPGMGRRTDAALG